MVSGYFHPHPDPSVTQLHFECREVVDDGSGCCAAFHCSDIEVLASSGSILKMQFAFSPG